MSVDQDLIFETGEGDRWFERNSVALGQAERPDVARRMLGLLDPDYAAEIRSVCDVGCANGWRLPGVASALAPAARLCGFDASAAAIADGVARMPQFDLRQGLVDAPPFDEQFDLVIVSFVLHWVDRARLATAIAKIDGLVRPGGALMIMDFLPDAPCARAYHHRTDLELYTFKQDYRHSFIGTGVYRELASLTFPHDAKLPGAIAPTSSQDRAVCAWLHKALNAYPVA